MEKELSTIFKLEIVEAVPLEYRCRKHYPQFKVRSNHMAFGATLEEAEQLMRLDIERRKEGDEADVMCYYIREVAMRRLCYNHEFVSLRMYDASGALTEQSCCSSGCYCDSQIEYDEDGNLRDDFVFHGHPEDKIRFHKGDIVEIYGRDEVSLAVVAGTPPTLERIEELKQRAPDLCCDEGDDCYLVLDGPSYGSHQHVPCHRVFAPHYPIPPYLERRYKEFLVKADAEEQKYIQQKQNI